jgi:hypothetical protein
MSEIPVISARRGKKKRKTRFQRLWADAEAIRKDNRQLACDLDMLVSRVEAEILPVELDACKIIRKVVDRQLDFSEKKSMTKWQRRELDEWIEEHINDLMTMGLMDKALQDRLAEKFARENDIDLDDELLSPSDQLKRVMSEVFHEDDADVDSCFEQGGFTDFVQQAGDPQAGFGPPFDDSDDASDDSAFIDEFLNDLFEESESAGIDPPGEKTARLDSTVFKRLFRQTATALHPDREADPQKQLEKHELMSQLLKARKEHDLITLLRLHQQYAAAVSALSAQDEKNLEAVLLRYVEEQQDHREEIVCKTDLHANVFNRFYDKNTKVINQRIAEHLKAAIDRKESMLQFMSDIKTLKRLKEILAVRYDQTMQFRQWPFID